MVRRIYRVILIVICISFVSLSDVFGQSNKRYILFEEFTGTWCGWCPRGNLELKALLEEYPNIIPVGIHGGSRREPMRTEYGDELVEDLYVWYPSATIDRNKFEDDFYIQMGDDLWAERIAIRSRQVPTAVVSLEKYYQESSNKLAVTVRIEFTSADTGDFRYNVYVLEDNITGDDEYDQVNYLNTDPDFPELQGLGNPIVGYVHNNVLREMLAGPYGYNPGGDIGIPDTVAAGQQYFHTFTTSLDPGYKPEDIHLVAYVLRYGGAHDSEVLNAASVPLLSSSSDSFRNDEVFKVYPNPGNGFFNLVLETSHNEDLNLIVRNLQSQIVYQRSWKKDAGKQFTALQLRSMSPGIYIVEARSSSSVRIQKIVINN
ncbi:MAG: Omp28-related outer membrane protein [Bacteroidetes bacterium]|jgi:hypothetical protein|nr:Omp28-related outer membrane protein [Bacteroidota bacterium]MBT4400509.1 Omp28-related outer membrane protein [Bacteroidota bacterium]MBT4411027.1 Omp28-related outer membrane protein [Bacteroidota bacterium]MBT5425817.1 Omp28-related outer membrane protein [Bacteroidota bacterium]MBT7093550.1 Omp28-related outer membrane protein [Bacteroidota bacterium]